jgi:triosephosphate isomerase (TIM)
LSQDILGLTMARRPLVAGNWKMNGLTASAVELRKIIAGASIVPAADLTKVIAGASIPPAADLLICPPATLVAQFACMARGSRVAIGGQDCHAEPAGAFTGDISAEMLKDAGASAVIVGHSERRHYHGETDAMVQAKALAARRAGLVAIVCVGESRAERDAGHALDVVGRQLDGSLPNGAADFVVAYEPVWAIGTGVTPTLDDVVAMHRFIRERLAARYGEAGQRVRILYGGSVKPGNAEELLTAENVDGALIGGASLNADDFLAIAMVYR